MKFAFPNRLVLQQQNGGDLKFPKSGAIAAAVLGYKEFGFSEGYFFPLGSTALSLTSPCGTGFPMVMRTMV